MTIENENKRSVLPPYILHSTSVGKRGGAMELYETIEETAIRELREETGINIDKLELVTVLSGKDYYFEYPNGDKMCTVIVLFKVLNYKGEIKISDNESKELKFFSLINLPIMESRAKAIINKILDGTIKI